MNETKHDQYVLDASKQTNSLVIASATTSVPSACLLACSVSNNHTPHHYAPNQDAISHQQNSLGNLTSSNCTLPPYIHPDRTKLPSQLNLLSH
jgi:hypothetical protein